MRMKDIKIDYLISDGWLTIDTYLIMKWILHEIASLKCHKLDYSDMEYVFKLNAER